MTLRQTFVVTAVLGPAAALARMPDMAALLNNKWIWTFTPTAK